MLQTSDVAEGSRKCDHVSNICGTMFVQVDTSSRGHLLGNVPHCVHIIRCPFCRASCFSNVLEAVLLWLGTSKSCKTRSHHNQTCLKEAALTIGR